MEDQRAAEEQMLPPKGGGDAPEVEEVAVSIPSEPSALDLVN